MTDRALLQQALDALEYHAGLTPPRWKTGAIIIKIRQRRLRKSQIGALRWRGFGSGARCALHNVLQSDY